MFITVYAEATPNPESIKFVFNVDILPEGVSYDFQDMESAQTSPLAAQLFKFNFVKGVYISQNFVTISKVEDSMWAELIPIVRAFLKEYVTEKSPIVTAETVVDSSASIQAEDSDAVKKIKEILNTNVRPVVEMDGGNIEFKSFDHGIVTLALKGSCSGCPSSTITLKSGIEHLLKRMVPEVEEVVAEAM
jgi:NFU1 iron-sulfur cluster scaffold homolog, mitochondrial